MPIAPPPPMDPVREYQYQLILRTMDSLDDNPILVLATGGGKTVTASSLVRRLDRTTLWIAHRQELVLQAERQLSALGLNTGVIMSGYDKAPDLSRHPIVWVASVQTLAGRDMPGVELVVVDEAHHGVADGYMDVYERTGCPRIGLTATPFRLDGRGLGEAFGRIIRGPGIQWLIDNGYLVDFRVYAGASPVMDGVAKVGGDYVKSQTYRRSKELIGDLVEHYRQMALGRPAIAYGINVQHSVEITKAFSEAGFAWAHIDGKTGDEERSGILARLESGDLVGVSNCAVFTEGVDMPCLSCMIDAAPTGSLQRHIQKVGRVLRTRRGKTDAIILDHAGNHHTHGLVTREMEYSLESDVSVAGEPLGMKRCPACQLLTTPGTAVCVGCGYDFLANASSRASLPGVAHDEILVEFKELFDYQAEVWRMLLTKHGYGDKAKQAWRERFGRMPVLWGSTLVDPCKATQGQKAFVYSELLREAVARGYKEGWASRQYRGVFGTWPSGFVGEIKDSLGIERTEWKPW